MACSVNGNRARTGHATTPKADRRSSDHRDVVETLKGWGVLRAVGCAMWTAHEAERAGSRLALIVRRLF